MRNAHDAETVSAAEEHAATHVEQRESVEASAANAIAAAEVHSKSCIRNPEP
jgi:hypothetical protein